MDLLCGQRRASSHALNPNPAAFMCRQQSKLHKIQKSCMDWPVPAHHMCYTCMQYFNACTSHIHYRLCRSFISPTSSAAAFDVGYPGVWGIQSWGMKRSGSVLLLPGRGFSLIPLAPPASTASFCCLQSLTPSHPHSPQFFFQHVSNIYYQQNFFSTKMDFFYLLHTLFFVHSATPAPLAPQ